MRGITAREARNIQAAGTSQEDYIEQAILRCENAVIDVAKNRQESNIVVMVFNLTPDGLQKVCDWFLDLDFVVKSEFRDIKRSLINLNWSAEHAKSKEESYVKEDDYQEITHEEDEQHESNHHPKAGGKTSGKAGKKSY